jgi:hypothetical protein
VADEVVSGHVRFLALALNEARTLGLSEVESRLSLLLPN